MVTRLTIEYDGRGFFGWARQLGLRTVEETVTQALRTVLGDRDSNGEPLTLTVAGRTDKGVHAWGQVASYKHQPVEVRRINALLPDDVAVIGSRLAPDGFDARKDALSRTYCYRVLSRPARSVASAGRALWLDHELDLEAMRACAEAVLGKHDFTAFTPTRTDHVLFEREVLAAEWRAEAELLELWIEAVTFMRHMTRILVGTMLEVGRGKRSVSDFVSLLAGASRAQAGPTAPPHGLALASVRYLTSSVAEI